MYRLLIAFVAYVSLMQVPLNVDAAELVYFGSPACSVCETWNHEVGEIYPKTEESKILPLRYHNVHDDRPDELAFIKGVVYTPTFVAIENGRELGRIVGYMGDFFFGNRWAASSKSSVLSKPCEMSARVNPNLALLASPTVEFASYHTQD